MSTLPPAKILEALQHRRDGISMAAAQLIIDLRLEVISLQSQLTTSKPVTPLNDAQPADPN